MSADDRELARVESVDQRILAARFFRLLAVLGEVEPSVLLKEVEGNTALAKAVRRLLQIPEPIARGRGRPADSVYNEALVLCVDATVAAGGTVEAAIRRIVEDEGLSEDPNRFETLRTRYRRVRKARGKGSSTLSGLADLFSPRDSSSWT